MESAFAFRLLGRAYHAVILIDERNYAKELKASIVSQLELILQTEFPTTGLGRQSVYSFMETLFKNFTIESAGCDSFNADVYEFLTILELSSSFGNFNEGEGLWARFIELA